jgi:hypothetical protein
MAPGPYGSLYVLIPSRKAPATLVLLDAGGQPMARWPVVVPHATSCDQLLAVGDGSVRVICAFGTVHALVIEPESGGKSSATILAIEADSSVTSSTTIIDP